VLDLVPLVAPPWHLDAACRGQSPSQWVPDVGANLDPLRETCRRCPVRRECTAEALDDRRLRGCWGGTSDQQRVRARRQGWTVDRLLAEVDAR
jgi:hypothetical protein